MAKSIQEQMLKMGLVNKQQANKAKKEKSKKTKQQNNSKTVTADQIKQQAQRALAEKTERDRQLNLQHKERAEQKAIQAQIKELIKLNRLPEEKDGEAYNFTDHTKIKTVYISGAVRDQITRGRLAVVSLEGKYSIVSQQVAEKIQQRDKTVVVVLNEKVQQSKDENDPYADFEVPDDLMW
jgi:hypothetical protein